ncbi:MAG: pyruvate kinase, partial [Chlamydiota bacterium]
MADVNHTKIVCTIGPSCQSVEKMLALIDAGMNVARLNFSHGTHAGHLVSINNLKEARNKSGKPLAILMDTKGPEIRVGTVKGSGFPVKSGDKLFISKKAVEGTIEAICLTPPLVFDYLKPGMTLLIDNGYISSQIVSISNEGVIVEIENGGIISSNKGINIPGHFINLPAVTEKDIEDIRFALKEDVDMIAASFVRSKEHVEVIRILCIECGKPETLIIAKIENYEGVDHFEDIVQVADGIMVARGDLGVELPVEQVPRLQKMMIRQAYLASK